MAGVMIAAPKSGSGKTMITCGQSFLGRNGRHSPLVVYYLL